MALNAACVFEIRTTGNDSNGGGFNSGAAGTDRSQQDAAHITLTVAATVHTTTTQLNVPGGEFTVSSADVGNIYQITGGTATAGFYEITAVDVPNNRWTVDRSMGTAGQTAPGSMGGALASPGKFGAVPVQSGNICWIKSGTYSITSASTNIAGGCYFNNGGGGIKMEGYQTTRGDRGTKPLIQASGISTFTLLNFNTNNAHIVTNLKLDGASLTSSRGLAFRSRAFKCEVVNCTNSAYFNSAASPMAHECIATGCSTQPAFLNVSCTDCIAYNNTVTGFDNNGQVCTFVRCISDSNSGASSDGFLLNSSTLTQIPVVTQCVAYNNGREGFRVTGNKSVALTNCIAEDNAAFGFLGTTFTNGGSLSLYNCAGFSNASGEVSGLSTFGENLNFQTLTGSAFTDAANQDFSLNNTASAGAACRAAGFPGVLPIGGTGYIDIGTLQHQDAGGGGSPTSAAYLG